jgi:presequence protease
MDKFETGKEYEGFKLLKTEHIDEISSEALIFEHTKTGAKLLYLKNDEKERAFSITFRTPTDDNTGLPHILEHSVLCGSENFPTKDPFAELNKGTITTFLNAFTFPDKTMYPFSTTNESEFRKLMNVYLDAVLRPNIYKQKEIFLQEGWRFDFDENDNLIINGVVYSEMKGALSSPDSMMEYARYQNLFPETQYNFNFGGDPKHIPELTYEKFLSFHKTYYHPSNSYIYLYGDLNITEELKFINNEYLSKYEKLNVNSSLKLQQPFSETKEKTIEYAISKNESPKNKYHLEYSFVVDKATNPEKLIAFDILSKILIGTPASPLRRALIDANLGEDVSGSFNEEDIILQPIINIKISNTEIEKKEQFTSVLFDTLKQIAKEGINPDLIKAAINKREFELKEKIDRYPVPIVINLDIINSWLYDSEPLSHIKYNNHLKKIKQESQNRYFEKLIEEYLLGNTHRLLLILEPNSNYNPQEELSEKLKEYKNNLTAQQMQEIKNEAEKVKQWQENEDSKENREKIKTLPLDAIDKLPQKVESKRINTKSGKVLHIKDKTKGINYINMFFDAKTIPDNKIEYLSLLSSILHESRTQKHDYEQFSNIINIYTGGIYFNIQTLNDKNNNSVPKFSLSTKYLKENQKETTEILNSFFNNIIFEEKKILDILKKLKSRYEISIIENGHIYAISKVKSQYSENGLFKERTSGISYYLFLKNLINDFNDKKDEIIKNITETYQTIFNKNNLISSLVSEDENADIFDQLFLKESQQKTYNLQLPQKKSNEAFSTTSQVNYVAKGFSFKELGFSYTGKVQILRNFLGYGFMWEELRMKGGAYGAMTMINRDCDYIYVTYRDPHIKNTLKTFDKIPQYLKNLNIEQKEITKYIIGTIADLDIPLKPHEKGFKTLIENIKNITYADLAQERTEILNTNLTDIKNFAPMIEKILEQNIHSTIGNETAIEKNRQLFDEITNPFK